MHAVTLPSALSALRTQAAAVSMTLVSLNPSGAVGVASRSVTGVPQASPERGARVRRGGPGQCVLVARGTISS